ncbi:MAG: SulP family inorganic anion transporter [Myxococcales bacterium]|nr:SulP family inorganic anion transporter [Myxococcales bacterium]
MFGDQIRRFAPGFERVGREALTRDLVAGMTVACLAVPQGMAYALIAGVPPEMGLWAATIPALLGALFGSSPHLVTGPTNAISLVIGASVVGPVVAAGGLPPIETVLAIAVLAGAILAAFGLLGLGRGSRFMSDSVIGGFAAGAGLLIALRQVPSISGLDPVPGGADSLVPNVWPTIRAAVDAISTADARSLGLALVVPLGALAARRLDPRIPGALLALVGASVLAHFSGWLEGPGALATIGSIPARLPELALPQLQDPVALIPTALAIAMLAITQSIASARAVAPEVGDSARKRFDPDRELFAQGLANLGASLVGALPGSGSLTRSALARSAGGRSRITAASSGLLMLAVVPLAAPLLAGTPLAALAGLVVLSGLDLIDLRSLRRAAVTRGDAVVVATTIGTTLWIDLVQAIYAGLFLSLVLLVRRSGRLQLVEIVRAGPRSFREIPVDGKTGATPAVMLHLEGDLNFSVAGALADQLLEVAGRGAEVLILRLKRARYLDSTVLEALRRVVAQLDERGVKVLLCGLTEPIARLIERTEIGPMLGPEGLLRAGPRLSEGFEKALERTRARLRPRTGAEIFRSEEPEVPGSYEI